MFIWNGARHFRLKALKEQKKIYVIIIVFVIELNHNFAANRCSFRRNRCEARNEEIPLRQAHVSSSNYRSKPIKQSIRTNAAKQRE